MPCAVRVLGTWPFCVVDCYTEDTAGFLVELVWNLVAQSDARGGGGSEGETGEWSG